MTGTTGNSRSRFTHVAGHCCLAVLLAAAILNGAQPASGCLLGMNRDLARANLMSLLSQYPDLLGGGGGLGMQGQGLGMQGQGQGMQGQGQGMQGQGMYGNQRMPNGAQGLNGLNGLNGQNSMYPQGQNGFGGQSQNPLGFNGMGGLNDQQRYG